MGRESFRRSYRVTQEQSNDQIKFFNAFPNILHSIFQTYRNLQVWANTFSMHCASFRDRAVCWLFSMGAPLQTFFGNIALLIRCGAALMRVLSGSLFCLWELSRASTLRLREDVFGGFCGRKEKPREGFRF